MTIYLSQLCGGQLAPRRRKSRKSGGKTAAVEILAFGFGGYVAFGELGAFAEEKLLHLFFHDFL